MCTIVRVHKGRSWLLTTDCILLTTYTPPTARCSLSTRNVEVAIRAAVQGSAMPLDAPLAPPAAPPPPPAASPPAASPPAASPPAAPFAAPPSFR